MAETICEQCEDYFMDPRILPCLHSFCLQCIEKELSTQKAENTVLAPNTLVCPTCKEKVILPKSGLAHLPQDLRKSHEVEIAQISDKVENAKQQCEACGRSDDSGKAVAFCMQCKEFLCKICEDRHGKRPTTAFHNMLVVGQRLMKTNESSLLPLTHEQKASCPLHREYPLEAYCMVCEKLVCKNCMDFDHYRHRSRCNLLSEVAGWEMEKLQACQADCDREIASLGDAIGRCRDTMGRIDARKKEVDAVINESLEKVRQALLMQNKIIRSAKMSDLEAQVKELEAVRDRLSLASRMMLDAQSHTHAQQLSTKKVLAERTTKLRKDFEQCKLHPTRSDQFTTYISTEVTLSKMISLGCVSSGGHQPPGTSDAGYIPLAVVGKQRIIKVVANDKDGQPYKSGGDKVEAKLIQGGSQCRAIKMKTIDHGDGTYSVCFVPQCSGKHELQVTVADIHIRGSPFNFFVSHPRQTPYTAMSAAQHIPTYSHPVDIAVTEEGILALAETGHHTVTLYSKAGRKIHSFGFANSSGHADGQFHSPSAVTIRGDLMYVCEAGNNRIQKFSLRKRSFLSRFGSKGQGNWQFSNPRGIITDPEGKVFVADYGNHRIQVFKNDSSFAYSFPCKHPWGLAFDVLGHLHVAVNGSNSIHIFKPDGTVLTSYGRGSIRNPSGIAINGEGYIAISENGGRNRLWIYGPDYALVHTLSDQFKRGGGIACDNDGDFWVTDYGSNRITKY